MKLTEFRLPNQIPVGLGAPTSGFTAGQNCESIDCDGFVVTVVLKDGRSVVFTPMGWGWVAAKSSKRAEASSAA